MAWLFGLFAMVFIMVVLGGVTRLTESGLSMVDWRPVAGILPPMSEAAWREAFSAYRDSPEFQRVNFWMTLADFKTIYWMEFSHRVWGRAIGVAFVTPFLFFTLRRRLDGRLTMRLVFAFVLGGLQGVLGWYMVKSGLVDRPDVSQYRLAAHLLLAMLILCYLLWLALGLLGSGGGNRPDLAGHVWLVLVWGFGTAMWGAFVAGIDAGHAYNTFPLMGGAIAPPGMLAIEPWPLNFFENAATVQFAHRILAILLVLIVIALWFRAWRNPGRIRLATGLLALTGLIQAGLGVATLLSEVNIVLAAGHQAGAMVLISLAIWVLREVSNPNPTLDPADHNR